MQWVGLLWGFLAPRWVQLLLEICCWDFGLLEWWMGHQGSQLDLLCLAHRWRELPWWERRMESNSVLRWVMRSATR